MSDLVRLERRLDWEFTRKCNLRCHHCISRIYYHKIQDELSLNESYRVLDHCRQADIDLVHFFGGEPTFRKDFRNLLLRCDDLSLGTSFTTNGTFFNEEFVDFLGSITWLRGIFVSFEDILEPTQDYIRGDGTFLAASHAVSLCKSKNPHIPIFVSFTLNRPVMHRAHPVEILNFFAEMSVDKVIFQELAIPNESWPELKDLAYDAKTWLSFLYKLFHPSFVPPIPFVYELKPLVIEHLNRLLGTRLPIIYCGCNALGTEFRLLPNGLLIPCSAAIGWSDMLDAFLSQNLRLSEKPLKDILASEVYQQFVRAKSKRRMPFMEPCSSCHFAYRMCNPCIFGRLSEQTHTIWSCFWVWEEDNGVSRVTDLHGDLQ